MLRLIRAFHEWHVHELSSIAQERDPHQDVEGSSHVREPTWHTPQLALQTCHPRQFLIGAHVTLLTDEAWWSITSIFRNPFKCCRPKKLGSSRIFPSKSWHWKTSPPWTAHLAIDWVIIRYTSKRTDYRVCSCSCRTSIVYPRLVLTWMLNLGFIQESHMKNGARRPFVRGLKSATFQYLYCRPFTWTW